MLIPFRYTSQSNLPDSRVDSAVEKGGRDRERDRKTLIRRGRNVKSLRNKRFHSPYPGRITGTRGESERSEKTMKFIVSRRLNSGERGDCPDTLAPSPPSLANRSFCRMVGGVSRRISEASDIRVTIRIAGEFGVDGDKAWHRIECVYVCVFPLFPSISPCSIAQRGSSSPLFPERAVCAASTFKLIQRTYMNIYVCVYA